MPPRLILLATATAGTQGAAAEKEVEEKEPPKKKRKYFTKPESVQCFREAHILLNKHLDLMKIRE